MNTLCICNTDQVRYSVHGFLQHPLVRRRLNSLPASLCCTRRSSLRARVTSRSSTTSHLVMSTMSWTPMASSRAWTLRPTTSMSPTMLLPICTNPEWACCTEPLTLPGIVLHLFVLPLARLLVMCQPKKSQTNKHVNQAPGSQE